MSSVTGQGSDADDAVEYVDGRAVKDWNPPWQLAKHPMSSGKFGEKHDIYAWALPLKYYESVTPYEAIKEMSEYFQEREPYRRQVSRSAISTAGGAPREVQGVEEIALINGWWKGGKRSTAGEYYCNPAYPHDYDEDELLTIWGADDRDAARERRKEAVHMAAGLGLSSEVLARPFGVKNHRSVAKWCSNHDIDYRQLRREGKHKMARTWKTINHWGKTKTEIAQTFNIPRTTLRDRIDNYAADFEPPDEPSLPEFKDGGGS